MCGIVGILGNGPVAGLLVEALGRLEYRGYDSAGVATLESGKLVRRRAAGQAEKSRGVLAAEPLHGRFRRRPYALGDAWQADGNKRPSASQRESWPSSITASSRISASSARSLKARGHASRVRDRQRSRRASGRARRWRKGLSPVDAVAASLPRLQGRLRPRLSVRRRGRSFDRRARRRAACHRLRQRGDANLSRLRCHRARAADRSAHLSRRRRLRRPDATGRQNPRCRKSAGRAQAGKRAGLGLPFRQRQLPALHGEGDPRAAGGRRPHAWRIISTCPTGTGRCRSNCRSMPRRCRG